MNILVYGAGAVGEYFGSRILEADYPVSFFVRQRRAKQIEEKGFKLHSPEGDFERKDISLYTSPEQVSDIDLIILSVKGYHLDQVIPQLKTIVERTGAFVLPLLNGIEHIHRLDEELGKEKVLGGFAYIIATLDKDGHVVHGGNISSIKFGLRHESQKHICEKLEAMNQYVNTNIRRTGNIYKEMWRKYLFITAFSGITSSTQLTTGDIVESEATLNIYKKILFEMSLLAEKEGILFAVEEIEKFIDQLRRYSKDATSSMHQDLRKGLPIEVEHLHGGAIRLATKHQIQLPVIETIYGILKPYENGSTN